MRVFYGYLFINIFGIFAPLAYRTATISLLITCCEIFLDTLWMVTKAAVSIRTQFYIIRKLYVFG